MVGPAEARALATLLRWMGPWAGSESSPPNIHRREIELRPGYRAFLYSPRTRPIGSYVIAPGLHFAGPAEPRMDRFFRIVAAAGFEVLAPFLPDFIRLKITPALFDGFSCAFDWLAEARQNQTVLPGVFSISFGSLPALQLAGNPSFAERLSHLVCFGGFASLPETLRFCMTSPGRDPLNQPAAFINLLPYLDLPDKPTLEDAWLRYVHSTWGRQEMKAPALNTPVAQRIARELEPELRESFFLGTGHHEGGLELALPALDRMGEHAQFASPLPYLAGIRCPVSIVHGRDDDVIEVTQATELARAFPSGANVRVHLTGLYDHSRPSALGLLPGIASMLSEGRSMVGILRALALGHRSGPSSRFARS